MVDPIFQSTNYQLATRLLDASALRAQAIAANIANAETPNYRRVDLAPDFAAELGRHLTTGERPSEVAPIPKLIEDTTARALRPDGNNVEVDRELLAMNRNTVEHEFLSEIVSRNLKQLRLAITGRPA
jgi:flagellar basal-body rod protein FlgB